jgi:alpha-ribazole phosphatase
MEIYLIRHTTPNISKGICYGQTDLEIDENSFEKEFQFIVNNLPEDIEKFYSSPLKRCAKLAEKLSVDFSIDERLIEMNFGDWENQNWNNIDQDKLQEWMQDFVNVSPPNGENYYHLHLRTVSFIHDILKTNLQKVAIITHAGNIRSFLSYILSLPLKNSFRISLHYASVVATNVGVNENSNQLISIQHFKNIEA